MIVVKIELWPHGDEQRKRELGVAYIANDGTASDGTGNSATGNYDVRLMKSPEYAQRPGVWKKARVVGFPRQRLGPWDLLYRALDTTVGSRNRRQQLQIQMTGPSAAEARAEGFAAGAQAGYRRGRRDG